MSMPGFALGKRALSKFRLAGHGGDRTDHGPSKTAWTEVQAGPTADQNIRTIDIEIGQAAFAHSYR